MSDTSPLPHPGSPESEFQSAREGSCPGLSRHWAPPSTGPSPGVPLGVVPCFCGFIELEFTSQSSPPIEAYNTVQSLLSLQEEVLPPTPPILLDMS